MKKFPTKIKDQDLKILSFLDDEDLFKFCKYYRISGIPGITKFLEASEEAIEIDVAYMRHICSEQNFWKNRLKERFPDIDLSDEYWNKFSWRDKYLATVSLVSEFKEKYNLDYTIGDPRYYLLTKLKYKGTRKEFFQDDILDLSSKQLKKIPREIGNLTNLRILYLNNNKLKELPKEIGNLTNLEQLTLDRNKLEKLPKEIGNLTNLEYLLLKNNKLEKLPKEIGNLTKLDELDLRGNQLEELPEELRNLPIIM